MLMRRNGIKCRYRQVSTGLDAYFFPNLAVGQPSNNMDLSEIEIYLGIMIIFFCICNEKITKR